MKKIKECTSQMQKISKTVIFIGFCVTLLIYAVAFIIGIFAERLFGDYTTGVYWAGEVANLAKEMLGATVVPMLIMEILLAATRLSYPDIK